MRNTHAITPTHPDYALGYYHPLDTHDIGWLASEVRMLHGQVEREKRERRESEQRAAAREAAGRHRIAHELDARRWSWKLGKHATTGALRALDAVYPISQCPSDCPERGVTTTGV